MRLNSFMSLGATLLLAAAVGCAGELDPMTGGDGSGNGDGTGGGDGDGTGGDNAQARALFDALHPTLMAECQACHLGTNDAASVANGPDVLGPDPDPDAVYDSLINGVSIVDGAAIIAASPADSKLYFYGSVPHTGSLGMSEGLAAQVEDWIIAEAQANGEAPEEEDPGEDPGEPEPPTGPTDRFQALQMFASCMRYEDFQATTMDEISEIATDQGACNKCHGTGNFGAYISDNDIDFYIGQRSLDANGELVATSIFAFATALPDGTGNYIIEQTYRYERKGVGVGIPSTHPNYLFYDGNGNELTDQVDLFFNATLQRYEQALASGTPCVPDNPQQQ